ncbi:Crp/Fnr family transcriptional regulator [uncultured Selenomonas sp.]|uniref:Crp/Fnr family transcriptional regulator n=1 Tax=uncultured Selenomonas sp. TaxID=159275 RepID=UPI0025D2D021|nr:Crp/Fnr family transcriptional regulator [uncultured Selenomonas sp.]
MDILHFAEHMPETIRQRAVKRVFRPGEALMRKGEPVTHVYLLTSGATRVSNEFESGHRYTFAQIDAPDILGDLEALSHQESYATTNEALTQCTVYALTIDTFYAWLREDNAFAIRVAELLAIKMYPTSDENGRIKFLPSVLRLENYLLHRIGGVDTDLFVLHTGRQEIADDIGTSVKTVNRGVTKLKEAGLIGLSHGKITISREQKMKIAEDLERSE